MNNLNLHVLRPTRASNFILLLVFSALTNLFADVAYGISSFDIRLPTKVDNVIRIREGFWQDAPEMPALLRAWSGTVALVASSPEGEGIGSGVIVERMQLENGTSIGLIMTARHVVEGIASMGKTPQQGLDSSRIFTDLRAVRNRDGHFSYHQANLLSARIVWSTLSQTRDLGLLAIQLEDSSALPEPVPFDRTCDFTESLSHQILGFGETSQRLLREQKVPITDWKVVTKRWGAGNYLDRRSNVTNVFGLVEHSTADAIAGFSGGPSINMRGEIIGILSAAANRIGPYLGKEGNHPRVHAYIVGCQDTKNFFLDARERFMQVSKKLELK